MESSSKFLGFGIGTIVVLFLVLVLGLNMFTHINPGHHGLRVHLSQPTDKIYAPGWYWINPVDDMVEFETRVQKIDATASASSQDLQTVNTSVTVNYSLDPTLLKTLYLDIGTDYENRIFLPAIQESVKAATAKFTAEQMVTQREDVKKAMLDDLRARLASKGIIVTDVLITNFEFSASFNAAVEQKVTAEQNALTAKNKLEQSKYEADQRIATAKGEAEAIKIQAQAINSQGGADYVKLKTIEKWNGQACTSYCGLEASTGLLVTPNK